MRDDRYSGMILPKHLKKLFVMSWREADRSRTSRMLEQATKVLHDLCKREVSKVLLSALKQHEEHPTLVDGWYLKSLSYTSRLGTEVSELIDFSPNLSSREAIRMALLTRVECYMLEQKSYHAIRQEAVPYIVSSSVKNSLRVAASTASEYLFAEQPIRHVRTPLSLEENLI